MGYWINPSSGYYEGDRANINDAECPQRPSTYHTWNGSVWALDVTAYKAAVQQRINDEAGVRIISAYSLARGTQNNMLARMAAILDAARTRALTEAELADRLVLESAWAWIDAVRAAAKTAKDAVAAAANDQASVDAASVVAWPQTTPPQWPV